MHVQDLFILSKLHENVVFFSSLSITFDFGFVEHSATFYMRFFSSLLIRYIPPGTYYIHSLCMYRWLMRVFPIHFNSNFHKIINKKKLTLCMHFHVHFIGYICMCNVYVSNLDKATKLRDPKTIKKPYTNTE